MVWVDLALVALIFAVLAWEFVMAVHPGPPSRPPKRNPTRHGQ